MGLHFGVKAFVACDPHDIYWQQTEYFSYKWGHVTTEVDLLVSVIIWPQKAEIHRFRHWGCCAKPKFDGENYISHFKKSKENLHEAVSKEKRIHDILSKWTPKYTDGAPQMFTLPFDSEELHRCSLSQSQLSRLF